MEYGTPVPYKLKMQNKFVLITGSGHGLGRELALVFAGHNYNIILHDRNKSDLEKTEKEISKKDINSFVLLGDLKSDKTLDSLYKISKKKKISVLINNAGVHCPGLPLEKIDDRQIDDLLLTNLIASIKLTRRIYRFFLENGHGGTIININSISGLENQEFRTVYCASKWGLRGFTDTLRLEAGGKNIRIIDIYPSRIKTRSEFTVGMETEEVAKKIYEVYENTNLDKVILDGRPKKAL
jgi:short-subunit dehydrogenase